MNVLCINKDKEKLNNALNKINQKYHNELLKKTLSFIDLGIQYNLAVYAENVKQEFSIESMIDQILNNNEPIALIGGPGTGKSTILIKLATMFSEQDFDTCRYIPIYIRCGLNSDTNIDDMICLNGFSKEETESLLKNGSLFLLFDGVNEVSGVTTDVFIKSIINFINKYPDCKYIISCRSIDFPKWAATVFEKYSVLPVTNKQIENKLKNDLGEEKGAYYYKELIHSSQNYLIDICRNPLLLSLVSSIIVQRRKKDSDFQLSKLKNKCDVYKQFCDCLTEHQISKKDDPDFQKFATLRSELIETLAFYMQGINTVYIKEEDLINIIRNIKYTESISKDLIFDLQSQENAYQWYLKVLNDIKKCSFFNTYEDSGCTFVSFIHQSFQEYFAGSYLSKHTKDMTHTIFLLQLDENNNLNEQNKAKSKRNWETIKFASNLDINNNVIYYTLKYAISQQDSDALVLAAMCILNNSLAQQNKQMVNDCCIWMLEAFKYWNIPYKYDLIYQANGLVKYVSDNFPKRIIGDIKYFGKKYIGENIATQYPDTFDYEHLNKIIIEGEDTHKINAIYTIGERIWDNSYSNIVIDYLFSLLECSNLHVREQIIKSIKRLIENNKTIKMSTNQLHVLKHIISNKNETDRIRTYALNTVAEAGDEYAIEIIMDYLKDKSNPYRDSASWSLQELLINSDMTKYNLAHMQQFYFNCLINETNDQTGKYAKGNLIYTLSKLNAHSYLQKLKIWLKNELEPYVQEDGINAIGVLSEGSDVSFIKEYTCSGDPVIRAKAYKSLKSFNYLFSSDEQEIIRNDQYSIVNYIAEDPIEYPTFTIDVLLEINSKNNEKPLVQQNYGNVNEVNNYYLKGV